MARDDRVSMPGSYGGLVRYYDEYKSKFQIKPAHVVALIIIVVVAEIALNFLGK